MKERQWHQIINPFEEKCHIIEIQYGDSVIEDDIERLSYYDDKNYKFFFYLLFLCNTLCTH